MNQKAILLSPLILLIFAASNLNGISKKESVEIIIRPQEKQEAFESLMWNISQMPFYNEHGYEIDLPSHKTFQKLANSDVHIAAIKKIIEADLYSEKLYVHDIQLGELKRIFESEVYSEKDFEEGIQVLTEEKSTFIMAGNRLRSFNESWNLKSFPRYEVVLTMYGVGGSFNSKSGTVIILSSKKWTLKKILHAVQ